MSHHRKYFSYDPEDGFEDHTTETEAMARCEESLDACRDIASDSGWEMSGVDGICWGIILGETQVTETKPAPEGSNFDAYEAYGLIRIDEAKPDRDKAITTAARLQLIKVVEGWRSSGQSIDQLIFRLKTVHIAIPDEE